MDSEDLLYLSVIEETVDEIDPEETVEDEKSFSASGDLVIEQLHPLEEGILKVAEVVPDSEEEDEPTEPSPVSSFVCARNHTCNTILKLMFPGWDTPNVCVGIDGFIPEIDMVVKAALEKGKRKAPSHGRNRRKLGDKNSHMAGTNKHKKEEFGNEEKKEEPGSGEGNKE
ncbi:hypothetical protein DM860_011392 [Cuscuta australis]|uniref:Uncharacterized protein n=1 Tax=Cuscuta australis TaxID=267555 RepID=A0A328DQ69_9ASTE|nr:hypothetical protein DM860_011392 [Cuscuta australis]